MASILTGSWENKGGVSEPESKVLEIHLESSSLSQMPLSQTSP